MERRAFWDELYEKPGFAFLAATSRRYVEWVTRLLAHAQRCGHTRIEARAEAERDWCSEVRASYERLLLRHSKGWFTGYNSNVVGHEAGRVRYQAYFGGGPKYRAILDQAAAEGYSRIDMR